MKGLISALIIFMIFLTGCMPFVDEGESPSAFERAMAADSQKMHYRPVHRGEPRWVIVDHGNTLVLRTGSGVHLRTSARRAEHRTVIRKDGLIVGNVVTSNGVVTFKPINRRDENAKDVSITCASHDVAILNSETSQLRITFNAADTQAESDAWQVRRYARHRLSVEPRAAQSDVKGEPLEVPFNALGTLIFNSDDQMPLNARFALASYVTSYKFSCGD